MEAEPMTIDPGTIARKREALLAVLGERTRHNAGTLIVAKGEVDIFEPETGRWHAATADAVIASGARVRIGKGRALLRLSDGSDVWLRDGSEIDLSPWANGVRSLKLAVGSMLALVAHRAKEPFRTLCPTGEILVTGTAFEASADETTLGVGVIQGSVVLSNVHGKLGMRAGCDARLEKDSKPMPVRAYKDPRTLQESWGPDFLASARNPAIAPAWKAVEKNFTKQIDSSKENETVVTKTRKGKKLAIAAAALLALGAIWFGGGDKVFSNISGLPVAGSDEASVTFRVVDKDGNETAVDARDAAAVEKALLLIPEEERQSYRDSVKKAVDETFNRRGPNSGGQMVIGYNLVETEYDKTLQREMKEGSRVLQDLLARGEDPKKAKEIAERAVADSLLKQLQAQNTSGDHIEVEVKFEGDLSQANPDTTKWSVSTTRGPGDEKIPPGVTREQLEAYDRDGTLPPGWTEEKLREWAKEQGMKAD